VFSSEKRNTWNFFVVNMRRSWPSGHRLSSIAEAHVLFPKCQG
jgi:hypothetical protein